MPYINLTMIGETGVGKSSLLNTFATALSNELYIVDTYRVGGEGSGEKSVTRTVKYMSACLSVLGYPSDVAYGKLHLK